MTPFCAWYSWYLVRPGTGPICFFDCKSQECAFYRFLYSFKLMATQMGSIIGYPILASVIGGSRLPLLREQVRRDVLCSRQQAPGGRLVP